MSAVALILVALAIGAIGIAAGIIVAPALTRAADRMSADERQEAPSRDDEQA